jgi:hypothetical protein
MGWGEGKSFMVGGVNGMGESRFYDRWRGWGKESRLGWVALMEWEKVVFMMDGGDGMWEESRFRASWW